MRRAAAAGCVLAIALGACGSDDVRPASCAGRPTAAADPDALGYAFLARMRDESQIEHFALLAGAREDRAAYVVDHGRGCVAFTGTPPGVRVGVATADRRLLRHVRDEATSEGVGMEPYAPQR
jgi:hypothetical protein